MFLLFMINLLLFNRISVKFGFITISKLFLTIMITNDICIFMENSVIPYKEKVVAFTSAAIRQNDYIAITFLFNKISLRLR